MKEVHYEYLLFFFPNKKKLKEATSTTVMQTILSIQYDVSFGLKEQGNEQKMRLMKKDKEIDICLIH